MKKIARFLLLVMLAVALPFHTAYAVGMAQCTAVEHSSEPAAPAASSHGDHGSSAGHDHGKHTDSSPAKGNDATFGGSHCGSCSACGTSTAITGGVLPEIVSSDYTLLPTLPERRLHSVVIGRLDRPPLSH